MRTIETLLWVASRDSSSASDGRDIFYPADRIRDNSLIVFDIFSPSRKCRKALQHTWAYILFCL
jgi:hypothetical protein